MTAIVAYRGEDGFHIVSDKRHTVAYGIYFDTAVKFTGIGDMVVYASGNTLVREAIEHAKACIEGTPTLRRFLNGLRNELETIRATDIDFSLLCFIDDKIYMVNARLDPFEIQTPLANLGVGGDYAEGYIQRALDGPICQSMEAIMRETITKVALRFNGVSSNSNYMFIPFKGSV